MDQYQPTIPPQAQAPQPAPSFFARHQRSIWLTLSTIALAVAAILGYILFFRKPPQQPEYTGDVRVEISAPKESVSGSEISYEIRVSNVSNTKITRQSIELFYPPGFSFLRAQTPDDSTGSGGEEGRTFALPDLSRGDQETLKIVGRLEGNVQEIKTISARLHYVPENFNSFFLANGSASVVILAPDITMRVLGPSSLISGQITEYEIEIRNISIEEFRNLSLELSFPPGFSFIEAIPNATEGQTKWTINELMPSISKTIKIKGRLSDPPGEDVYLAAELFTNAAEGKLSAGRSYVFTRMLDAPLLITQKLVGGEGTVFGGELLAYEINYENIGSIGLSNVTLSLRFETAVFDLTKAKSQLGQVKGSEVVWLPGAVPELRTVQVGQRGRFIVQIPLKAENLLTQKNPVASTRTQFMADELSEPIAGDVLSLKLGTNLAVSATAVLISGPKKPEIGDTSTYLVTLTVNNTVNDTLDGELTARLPGSTVTLDQSSLDPSDESANFEYVPGAGLLRWKLGKIFAYSGTIHAPRKISFKMSFTPEKQISGTPLLLTDVEATGKDSFTGEEIFSNEVERVEGK